MYSASQYRQDCKKSWNRVTKAATAWAKSPLVSDPFKSFGPCCLMVAWFFLFLIAGALFTVRRIVNI